MEQKAPKGREKNVINGHADVHKTGSGMGTGPVGNTGGYSGRPGTSSGHSNISRAAKKGGIPTILIVIVIAFFLFRGGGCGGSVEEYPQTGVGTSQNQGGTGLLDSLAGIATGSTGQTSTGGSLLNLLSGFDYTTSSGDYSAATSNGVSASKTSLDTTVAKGSRAKYTKIKGNGKDTVTIMVYMCGTDLESKSGMASSDLKEMCNADLDDNINLIVYTGGCTSWRNSIISNRVNQIYQIKDGGLICLEDNMGSGAMVDPDNLTEFIKYCVKNFPADRQNLIFWDHGGGSISGYGYDEKNQRAGSMNLAGINTALKNSKTRFDFIGFDACLMATVENGLMLAQYADYMIASEETEPGVGWYYTNWLSKYAKNTSMPTIEIGKNIVDDFVDVCKQKCNGQKTTLSVVDLAELENTVPDDLADFARSTGELISSNDYKVVSDARYNTKEFAQSSQIDQIDLVDFAKNLDTEESNELAESLLGAIKYNRTASCVKDAYGLSIYFPYNKASKVNSMANTYSSIGMDSSYTDCIKKFAQLEASGQATSMGSGSAFGSLFDAYSGSSSSSGSGALGIDSILSMLSGFSSGSGTVSSAASGFDVSSLAGLLMGMDTNKAATYIADNYFDADSLVWTKNSNGEYVINLSDEQWDMTHSLDLNVFYDDGEGFIDLGMDNVYNFDPNGGLLGEYDGTWLCINGQVVAYYHTDTVEEGNDYTITGYVPALLNGDRVELIIVFDDENPYGYISGAKYIYEDETETVAKEMFGLQKGDELAFLCDYYSYDGSYSDSYQLGETMILGDSIQIANIAIDKENTSATYCFTDMYNAHYWTPVIP